MALAGVAQATILAIMNLGVLGRVVLYGLVFLGRVGPTAFARNPLAGWHRAWAFFAALWLVVAVLM